MTTDELMALVDDHCGVYRWSTSDRIAESRAALRSALEQVVADSERYRWLRDEAWGGHVSGKRFPHVVEFRAGLMPGAVTELAEEALDAAIDQARKATNANT